ncbi:MAG: hypothetical protein PHI31_16340 [Desulfuromonadaceae bacterium]|nr:hypothetical protein [Desulfuromonadaceae bacterium]
MKTRYSMSVMAAAVALMGLTVPVTAHSQMKEMQMSEHREGHAQMMESGSMDKMGDMLDQCVEHSGKMGLSDDQLSKMKPIHREMQKKQVRFKADVKIAEIEFAEIMDVKNFDFEKASAAVKKTEELKTAHHIEMLKGMKEARSILTDDQFKNMKKTMPMKRGDKRPAKRMLKK